MDEKCRLDTFVASSAPIRPRTHARRLIESGKVLVNGKPRTKPSYILRVTDKVEIHEDKANLVIPDIDIPIIYEDKDCVVVDKPVGLLSHSKGAFNTEATVATWLSRYLTGDIPTDRDGIVHRLDRGTSGVMVCAKNQTATKFLQKQFANRNVKKKYLAIVEGELNDKEAIIDLPIERNPKQPQRFRVGSGGKSAMTTYKTLKIFKKNNLVFSLLELTPATGRTHQLRVHLKYLKHPMVGDDFYGGKKYSRLLLHADSLELTLPGGKRRVFKSTTPVGFERFMNDEANS